MNISTTRKYITELGGPTEAAAKIGVTRQAVHLWLKRGVSKYGILALERAIEEKRYGKRKKQQAKH